MKKFFKWVVLPCVLVLAVLVGLCFVPAVQKAVVLRALAGRVDSFEIGRISVGLGSARVEGLAVKQGGVSLSVDSADVSYVLTDALFRKKITLSNVALKKLAVDLSAWKASETESKKTAPAPTPETKAAPGGPLGGWTFFVGELFADSHVVLPGKTGTVDAELTGGALGTAQTGTAALALTFAGTANGEPVRTALHVGADLSLSAAALPVKLRLQGSVKSELARHLSSALTFSANILEASPGVREFNASVADANAELLNFKGSFDEAANRLQAVFALSLKNAQIAPFVAGLPVPAIDANASGNIAYAVDTGATQAQSTLSARVWDLAKVDNRLGPLGELRLTAATEVGYLSGAVEMRTLRADLYGPNDAHWMEARATQVFRCEVKDIESLAAINGEWVRVKINAFPLALANAFLSGNGLALGGGALSGEISFASKDKAVRVSNVSPLTVSGLSLSQKGAPLLQSVSLQANLNAVYKNENVAFGYGLAAGAPAGALLTASGSGSYRMASASYAVAGDATAFMPVIAQQPAVLAKLPPGLTIPYTLKAAYDLAGDAVAVKINRFDCTGVLGNGTPLSLKLLNPVSYVFKAQGLAALKLPSGSLLRLSADRLNLLIVQPLLKKGCQIESGDISAELVLDYQPLGVSLNASKPLVLSDFSFSLDGRPQTRHMSLTLTPKVMVSVQSLVDLSGIQIGQGAATTPALTGDLSLLLNSDALAALAATKSASQPSPFDILASANVSVSANLPALFATLPALSAVNNVSGGTLQLAANLDDSGKFKATAVLAKLKARFGDSAGSGIEGLSATLSGQYSKQPSFSLSGPLTVLGPSGTTQVTLAAQWAKTSSTAQRFGVSLSGDTLHGADLALAAAAFNPPTQNPYLTAQSAPKTPSATVSKTDTSAFWGDLTGSVRLNLKAITYGTFRIDQPLASVDISPTALNVSTLSARLDGFPIGLSGQLFFDAKNANPYSLSASAQITQVDMGKLLANSTTGKPILEGTFSAQAALSGRGINVENLTENLQGALSAQSSQGVLHLISASNNQTVQLIGGLASVVNTALGGIDSRIPMISPLLDLLSALRYDQFSLKINRGPDLNINFSEMYIRGKEAMIAANGRVTYQKGVPVLSQPLNLNAQLYLRGGMFNDLKDVPLFDSTPTDEGYYPGPVFPIRGSLSSPDTSSLKDILLKGIMKIGTNAVVVPAEDPVTGTTSAPATTTPSTPVKRGERLLQNVLKDLL